VKGTFPLSAGSTEPVAIAGAWTDDNTYTLKFVQYRQPFILTAWLRFAGDEVTVETEMNVGFGGTKSPSLTGKAQ
jgi:hypothetical protein